MPGYSASAEDEVANVDPQGTLPAYKLLLTVFCLRAVARAEAYGVNCLDGSKPGHRSLVLTTRPQFVFTRALGLKQIVDSPPRYARFETEAGTTLSIHAVAAGSPKSDVVIYFEVDNVDLTSANAQRERSLLSRLPARRIRTGCGAKHTCSIRVAIVCAFITQERTGEIHRGKFHETDFSFGPIEFNGYWVAVSPRFNSLATSKSAPPTNASATNSVAGWPFGKSSANSLRPTRTRTG